MNLNKVFANTLALSLAIGLVVFMIGVPVGFALHSREPDAMDGFLAIIAIAMYAVYWPIQIMLSIIHRVTSAYWERPSQATVLRGLLIGEWFWYLVIYLFCVCTLYGKDVWRNIFLFSVPYIISCTISTFLYKRFYEQELARATDATQDIQ